MADLLSSQWIFFFVLILVLFVLVVPKVITNKQLRRLLWGSFVAMVTSLLVVGKHPAPHYLIPGLLVAGVSLSVIAMEITKSFSVLNSRMMSIGVAFLALLSIVFLSTSLYGNYKSRNVHISGLIESEKARQVYADKNIISVFLPGSDCLEQGLYLGNSWAWYTYRKQLAEIYSNTLFLPFGATSLSGFDGEEQAISLLKSKKIFLLIGDSIPVSNFNSNLFYKKKNFYRNSHWVMRGS
ncbi:MAG: hypothetical protein J0L75_02835 [Spirochaetes bacterium]|nr:hypothetical protein [Spirochaetota bacterium]